MALDHKKTAHGDAAADAVGFSIDDRRLLSVAKKMVSIYADNLDFYHSLKLFPQHYYSELFHSRNDKRFLSQFFFIAAYFDTGKTSARHYSVDMMNVYNRIKSNRFSELFISDPEEYMHAMANPSTNHKGYDFRRFDLLGFLHSLDERQLNYFIRKVMKARAPTFESYLGKKETTDMSNNNQAYFMQTLDMLVNGFKSDPAKVLSSVIRKDGQSAAYEMLQEFPGVGPGLAFLTMMFYADSGLIGVTPQELTIPPKVDKNDVTVARLCGVLKVYEHHRFSAISKGLSEAMLSASRTLGVPIVDIDNAFWAASQISRSYPRFHDRSTARPFFRPEQFTRFDSSTYYIDSRELPDGSHRNGVENQGCLKLGLD